MKTNETVIRAKVDKKSARKAERVFARLGLTTDAAINLFLHQVDLQSGLPFAVKIAPQQDNSDILAPAAFRQKVLDSLYES